MVHFRFARNTRVLPVECFERKELLARDQANCLNIWKADIMQMADEFGFRGKSAAGQCCSTPKVENFHPQAHVRGYPRNQPYRQTTWRPEP